MTLHQCTGRSANRRGGPAGHFLALAAILAIATPSLAQTPPENAPTEKPRSIGTKKAQQPASSAQTLPVKAPILATKKQSPLSAPSAAGMPAPSQASDTAQGVQAQNPLTPLWGVINENYTNYSMGPLHKTQNVLIVEPVIPLKLTPDWNLVTRWNTPIVSMPRLADPLGPFPGIDPETGLSNMQPQFFFTPAHPGPFTFGVGPSLWLPTARDNIVGINEWGGGPVLVGLTTQGPLLAGFLAQNIWTGKNDIGQRVNTLTVMPFVFYNLPGGWFATYRPIITADWTVDSEHRWTIPVGGGFGRVFPVGNMVMDVHVQGFYNGITAPAAGATNVGKWTSLLVVHFLFPAAPVPSLF